VDAAAHAYKIDQLRHGLGAIFWDSSWYGGTYSVVDYGPLYYLCALVVPGIVLVVLAAGSLPLLAHLYLRRTYGVTGYLPAAALTVVVVMASLEVAATSVVPPALRMVGLAWVESAT